MLKYQNLIYHHLPQLNHLHKGFLRDLIFSLNILILNVATIKSKLSKTEDNLETTFQTNHLSYFLLVNLLLDRIKWTTEQQQQKTDPFISRIILVNSSLHKLGEGHRKIGPRLEPENLDGSKGFHSTKILN